MASVTLKNVVKQFKSVTAVENLSIEIQDREFAVLVGPSGGGKTTALRMVAGLEPVTSGEMVPRPEGQVSWPPARARWAHWPQTTNFSCA